jgi:nitroreductase
MAALMQVSEAVLSRFTCRAFLPQPVARADLEAILELASRSPSGGNLQPWRVWALSGAPLASLQAEVKRKLGEGEFAELPPEYLLYPTVPKEPYASRRFDSGELMYAALAVERSDHAGRMDQMSRNYECFGAPAALFFAIDRDMQQGQWAELGMFINAVMLLARERGLHTAAIGAWSLWHRTVRAALAMPDDLVLYCGMGVGHADTTAPINAVRQPRASLSDFAVFNGFQP